MGSHELAPALLACLLAPGCTACSGELPAGSGGSGGAGGSSSPTTTTPTSSTTTSSAGGSGGAVPGCEQFGGWKHFPGVDPACPACIPESLALVSPLLWQPCPGGTPGCQELVVDWSPPPERGPFYSNFTGAVTPVGPVITIGRQLGSELPGWGETVLARVDGPLIGAVRGRAPGGGKSCGPALSLIASGRMIAAILDNRAESPDGEYYFDYQVDIALGGGAPRVFSTLTPDVLHGNHTVARSAGPLFAAVSLNPTSEILTVPYDGSPPTVIAKFSMEQQWTPELPMVVGPDVLFWAGYQGRKRAYIYHSVGGQTEPYLDVPGYDIVAFRTDGETLVWVQSSPPYEQSEVPSSVELWRSPYSPNPTALVAEKIADLTPALQNTYLHFESGLVVLFSSMWQPPSPELSWTRKIVLRLADMVYWNVDAPPGLFWDDTMYAAPDEIAMPVMPPWDHPNTLTVRRQQLSALGPPTPLAGGVLGEP